MTKQSAITFLINEIYSKNSNLILSDKEIKKISTAYKKTQSKCDSYQTFIEINPEIKDSIEKYASVYTDVVNVTVRYLK